MQALSILVVEDSPSDVSLLQQIFLRTGKIQWSLTTVERLGEAINRTQKEYFDVVLLDLSLPDSDGLETVTTFVDKCPNLPVVVLTIAADENLALSSISQGAQDYLIKGEFNPTTLVKAIQHAIERGKLVQQLQQANEDLAAFSYSVAHDLRSPLRAIEGLSQAIKEDYGEVLDERGLDYANRIINSTSRLSTLIEDLLKYSRIGKVEFPQNPVALSNVVDDALALLQEQIKEQQAKIVVEHNLPTVRGHHQTLVHVVSNLLSNALKFTTADTPPYVHIFIELNDASQRQIQESLCKWIRLCIADNGIGIAPDHHDFVFGVFERLHTQESYNGTGIGLAIVRKAVEKMGGRVGLESNLQEGSKFWIELPEMSNKAKSNN